MEQLINKVLTRGTGRKANLEIKVFGGGMINARARPMSGAKNIEFVREFLAQRRLCDGQAKMSAAPSRAG